MEFLGRETVEVCRGCGEVLPRSYWRVDGDVVCAVCAEERRQRDAVVGRGCLERGLVFGWAAAVLGAFGQAGAWALTGRIGAGMGAWVVRGYLEIAVALGSAVAVGVAVRVGSRRRGGWPVQATAVGLTMLMFEGSLALWVGGSVGAMALRRMVAPWPGAGGGAAGVLPAADVLFGMALAWWVNREGRGVAVSGPFGYAVRMGRSGSPLPGRRTHSSR